MEIDTVHYHLMNGSYGCMPDNNEIHDSPESAADSAADLFGLGRRRTAELRRTWYLDLNSRRDGADYIEIAECAEDDCEVES